jgi:hypothetical protein
MAILCRTRMSDNNIVETSSGAMYIIVGKPMSLLGNRIAALTLALLLGGFSQFCACAKADSLPSLPVKHSCCKQNPVNQPAEPCKHCQDVHKNALAMDRAGETVFTMHWAPAIASAPTFLVMHNHVGVTFSTLEGVPIYPPARDLVHSSCLLTV